MKIRVLASDSFALLSTLNNHIAFKLRESKHDISDEFTRRRVVNDAHVENVNDNALIAEVFEKLNAVNETASNAV